MREKWQLGSIERKTKRQWDKELEKERNFRERRRERKKFFLYNVFTKSTGKIHCRYEAPREEPREAHGYLALGYDGYMVEKGKSTHEYIHRNSKEKSLRNGARQVQDPQGKR